MITLHSNSHWHWMCFYKATHKSMNRWSFQNKCTQNDQSVCGFCCFTSFDLLLTCCCSSATWSSFFVAFLPIFIKANDRKETRTIFFLFFTLNKFYLHLKVYKEYIVSEEERKVSIAAAIRVRACQSLFNSKNQAN